MRPCVHAIVYEKRKNGTTKNIYKHGGYMYKISIYHEKYNILLLWNYVVVDK